MEKFRSIHPGDICGDVLLILDETNTFQSTKRNALLWSCFPTKTEGLS